MNTEQIALALAIARENSITKAAASLFISQPTASSLLKKLETEIGFRIFKRERNGMRLTDEGKIFLEQAVSIKQSLEAIGQIGQGLRQINFTVHSFQLDFSALAFEALCERYDSYGHTGQMRFEITKNSDETARMVQGGKCDAAIILCLKRQYDSFRRKIEQMSLESVPLCEYPMTLICKKGHPILKNGTVLYDLLREYPGFSGVSRSSLEPYLSFFDAKLIGQARTTYIIDPGPMRYRLLHKTNGFLFSLPVSEDVKREYDLESVTLEDMDISVFAIFRGNSPKEHLISEYLELCKSYLP